MFAFFDFITNIIDTVVSLVTGFVDSALSLFTQMVKAYAFIQATVLSLPPFCQGALLMILALSLLTVVIGSFLHFA